MVKTALKMRVRRAKSMRNANAKSLSYDQRRN